MAGSWGHITTDDGKFRSETFWNGIENLGDAYEASEQCYGMVWHLAAQLADLLHAGRPRHREQTLEIIALAEARHKNGLALGGTEEE